MITGEKRFDGLAVSELQNKTHIIEVGQEAIMIKQAVSFPDTHCSIVEFTFDMAHPVRFRLDMLLPENAVNACVTLNSQVLIGFFSTIFPDGCEFPVPSICNDSPDSSHEKFSTLVPGKFQSISFKWAITDVLRYYLYYE